MDPMSVHCWYTDILLERVDMNQHILTMEQAVENAELELKNDKRELELFKWELDMAKQNIAKEQAASSDFTEIKRSKEAEIQKCEQTLAAMEVNIYIFLIYLIKCMITYDFFFKLQIKLAKYHIPAEVFPENIKLVENELESAYKERDEIKTTARNINLTKSARKDLTCLKNKQFKL